MQSDKKQMCDCDATKVNGKTLTNSSCAVRWLNVRALFKLPNFLLNAWWKIITLYSVCAFVEDL